MKKRGVSIDGVNDDVEHVEFQKKRKEHYKNEFNPAMLLKQKSITEDDDEEEGKGQ